ncbi:MAG: hypothetical protein AAF963_03425, partial [Bacteroidota bacterium]
MSTTTPQLRNLPAYHSNPFLEKPSKPSEHAFVSSDKALLGKLAKGIDGPVLLTSKKQQVEKEELVKIFLQEMGALFGLSKRSQKVLTYMLSVVGEDDRLIFN